MQKNAQEIIRVNITFSRESYPEWFEVLNGLSSGQDRAELVRTHLSLPRALLRQGILTNNVTAFTSKVVSTDEIVTVDHSFNDSIDSYPKSSSRPDSENKVGTNTEIEVETVNTSTISASIDRQAEAVLLSGSAQNEHDPIPINAAKNSGRRGLAQLLIKTGF